MTRLILALAALALVSGCGIRGPLERPGPLWGDDRAAPPAPAPAQSEDDAQDERPDVLPLPQQGALPPPQ